MLVRRPLRGRLCVGKEEGMFWESTDVLSADTTDVLSAVSADFLSADTTDVLSADTRHLCVSETTLLHFLSFLRKSIRPR